MVSAAKLSADIWLITVMPTPSLQAVIYPILCLTLINVFVGDGLVIASETPASQPNIWAQKASNAQLSASERQTYQLIGQLIDTKLDYLRPDASMTNAAGQLIKRGFDAIPELVEALSDRTVTQSRYWDEHEGVRIPLHLNELAASIISVITDRNFISGDDQDAVSLQTLDGDLKHLSSLQKAILDWSVANQSKSEMQRKIDDLEAPWFRNRLDATEWLGKRKIRDAVPQLRAYLERLETGRTSSQGSLVFSEMAEVADALRQIGDKSAQPAVNHVCEATFDHMSKQEDALGSRQIIDLEQLFRADAALGDKRLAVDHLTMILIRHRAGSDAFAQRDIDALLLRARNW